MLSDSGGCCAMLPCICKRPTLKVHANVSHHWRCNLDRPFSQTLTQYGPTRFPHVEATVCKGCVYIVYTGIHMRDLSEFHIYCKVLAGCSLGADKSAGGWNQFPPCKLHAYEKAQNFRFDTG